MKLPLSILAAALLLASCATTDKSMHPRSAATCNTNPCKVKVIVRDCRRIDVEPDRLDIPAGNRNDIEWEIHQNPGTSFVFTREGIEWKSGAGGGFNPGGGSGTTRYRWHNNNSVKGDHRYNVNVTQDNSRTICTEDPTIVNH